MTVNSIEELIKDIAIRKILSKKKQEVASVLF